MCGIAGIFNLKRAPILELPRKLEVMNHLQRHRGPDASGVWLHRQAHIGFAHRRLSIIDLQTGNQPMADSNGNQVIFCGEIYNYIELRDALGIRNFATTSDTEVILHAYLKWGTDCVKHFRGMFAFALWDEPKQMLFCARDRFGIKPFYYLMKKDEFYFASEAKTLLPFVDDIETDLEGFREYLVFQFCLNGKTLFKGIRQLEPAHILIAQEQAIDIQRYWQVYYEIDFHRTGAYFEKQIRECLSESVQLHMRSDVPVGAYLSGGLDSSIISSLASQQTKGDFIAFTGKFAKGPTYDESRYARALAESQKFKLMEIEITAADFIENIRKVIYHLDYPTAGPGAFPQYMVSGLAAKHRKVVVGGQGGDEIFGGYARYLIAYFEQCIKAAIDGTIDSGKFVVTYESIIPNLTLLRDYKPLLQEFWREGLFEPMDRRYFRLIDRSTTLENEINWEMLENYSPFETFQDLFQAKNVGKQSYFDSMTHFDFKTLLPALLHVEDRVSMAHGLESRVPFLDHPLVELAATIPADVKFKDGNLKYALRKSFEHLLPQTILNRSDKMGFPVPLSEWAQKEIKEFLHDIFSSSNARSRDLIRNDVVRKGLERSPKYSRKLWGLLSLELWHQEFHDKNQFYKNFLKKEKIS